jgi:hypothetical protein
MSNNEYRTAEVKMEHTSTSKFNIHYSTFCGSKARIVHVATQPRIPEFTLLVLSVILIFSSGTPAFPGLSLPQCFEDLGGSDRVGLNPRPYCIVNGGCNQRRYNCRNIFRNPDKPVRPIAHSCLNQKSVH